MNILVSGASRGIGKAIAQRFLDEGHDVYGMDIRGPGIEHEKYHHVVHDICNEDFPQLPNPHVIVSSAGTLEETDAIGVNLVGTINFTDHYAKSPDLVSILFVASASARNGAEFPQYVASKAGIVGYMKNTALAVAKRGITCNSVSPGGVITSSNDHILKSERLYGEVLAETLLGKWAQASEIADFAYFITMVNKSMTGEDVLIDNGEMLKSNFVW